MTDVVALGEILIDFTVAGKSADGKNIYEENPGGAPANCACAVAKLGGKAAFVGMTGCDSFGEDLRATLAGLKVDVSGMRTTEKQHTTLAFVSLDANGERHFSFCRNPGADTQLTEADLDMELLKSTKILHVGSLSLTDQPAKSTTLKAIEVVKKAGGIISYDPNWRANLWKGRSDAMDELKSLFKYADIVKVSDEELALLFGDVSCEEGAAKIHAEGVKLIMITLGSKGVYYSTKTEGCTASGTISVPKVKVADTTGAGDSFNGGLLFRLTRREKTLAFTKEELVEDINFANSVASLCVTKRGAIPALPTLEETLAFVKENY